MKNKDIISFDNLTLKGYIFDDVIKPIGIIQIIHGMQEYSDRYFDIIPHFNKNGFVVYISDLRAHGLTAKNTDELGKDDDIFNNCVEDQIIISQTLKKDYPNLPLYIFGHSFGSFIAQKYIQVCDLSKKVVLCGTSNCNNLEFNIGKIITYFTTKKNGKHGKATMIENMSFKSYAKKFEDGNWLSRDKNIIKMYRENKYCGTPFPVSFYDSLFKNGTRLNKGIKNIPMDTHILIIVGSADPVSKNSRLAKNLNKLYQKHCLKSEIIIYKDARHELLNEINKMDIVLDVINFYSK